MKDSSIEWCDHTFNPWIGCTKVSAGCKNCYAEATDERRYSRTLDGGTKEQPVSHWGKGAPRHRTSAANWKLPLRWNAERILDNSDRAQPEYPFRRPRVFCASLADWLDDEVPVEWLADLLALIHATPNLGWLLLTKRPENFRPRLDAVFSVIAERASKNWDQHKSVFYFVESWLIAANGGELGTAPAHVWIGTSVEDQTRADERIPRLLEIPALVRFLSCEPLLAPVDLREFIGFGKYFGNVAGHCVDIDGNTWHSPNEKCRTCGWGYPDDPCYKGRVSAIHWVICGGESGRNARPMHPDWARSLRDQCSAAGVPFLFKQWGEWGPGYEDPQDAPCKIVGSPHQEYISKRGKKHTGRLLDGREWNEFPTVKHAEVRA